MKSFTEKTKMFIIIILCAMFFIMPEDAKSQDLETYKFVQMWPVMEQPWYFFQPDDVCVDQLGFVYVADTENNRIQKFTSDGQLVSKWGTKGSADNEMHYPSGITSDNNGFIYTADSQNNRILKFSSTGEFIAKWGTGGTGESQFSLPHDLAVYEDIIYVADTGNKRIQKFNTDGKFLEIWGGSEYNFQTPYGIETDRQGFVYAADSLNNRIIKISPDGSLVHEWNNIVNVEGAFNYPFDIAVDSSGYFYVSNVKTSSIKKFDRNGSFLKEWGQEGRGAGEFHDPHGIAVDKSGYIYVADTGNNRIQKFAPNMQFMTKWGTGSEKGELNFPHGIEIDSQGNIYAADTENFRIQKFNENGQYIDEWGTKGTGAEEFMMPGGIAIGSKGAVYIVDSNNLTNGYIREFTDEGVPENQWGEHGALQAQFRSLQDIAVLPVENAGDLLFAADKDNNRIQKFNADGTFIEEWKDFNDGKDSFKFPRGIAAYRDEGKNGFIYVSDTGNHRILKFDETGKLLNQWGGKGNGDGEFNEAYGPYGIAVDIEGCIYAADWGNHRILKFDKDGGFITKWGTLGTDPGQMNKPVSLAVGNDGRVYVSDSENHRIQVFEKAGETVKNKAVIVAGGGAYAGNYLWDATRMCANFAYRTLIYQGLSKNDIYYLSEDIQIDLDNNGTADDIYKIVTEANLKEAVIGLAKDTDNLIVYLTDHGGEKNFRLNRDATLTASVLDSWLDYIQEFIHGKVIVIYDACESGSFLSEFTPPQGKDRIFIGSTSSGESAYFVSQGAVSFSNYFWSSIFTGADILSAFETAAESINLTSKYQNPVLDDNNDGIYDETDGSAAEKIFIGKGSVITGDLPVLENLSVLPEPGSRNSALIKLEKVIDTDGTARVWASILPPGFKQGDADNTVQALPSIDLMPQDNGSYEAVYENFNFKGKYEISVYAKDRKGNTSIPEIITYNADDPLQSKAVIIAGGPETDPLWPGIAKNAELAYNALKFQGYSDDNIIFMSPVNFSPEVDLAPALADIETALGASAGINTKNMVLYLAGKGEDKGLRLNNTEILTAGTLDTLLDNLQKDISGEITVITDFFLSSSFVKKLVPLENQKRILISSTSGVQSASFASDGDISFSRYFWNRIINGSDLYTAFIFAKNTIWLAGQGQIPMIDDNGNGTGNEKTDGTLAREIRLGAGIYLTGNSPLAQGFMPEQILNGETTAQIRLENISSTGTIKVWAVISPPADFRVPGESNIDLPIIELSEKDGIYELNYNNFDTYGKYIVSIYAQDEKDNVSAPVSSAIYQKAGPDAYEQDDNPSLAGVITLSSEDIEKSLESPGIQKHNFHSPGDEDWVKFYAVSGMIYEIKTENPGTRCDTAITLFDIDKTTIIKKQDDWIDSIDKKGELLSWKCPENRGGIYYVKISHSDPNTFGTDTGYDLLIYRPVGPLAGFLSGSVTDALTGQPLTGAVITTDASASALSRPGGRYLMIQEPGTFNVSINIEGYLPYTGQIVLEEGGTGRIDFPLTPIPPKDMPSYVIGIVTDASTGQPLTGAVVKTDANASAFTRPGGNYMMLHEPGTFSITVELEGYETYTGHLVLSEGEELYMDFSLTPSDVPGPVIPDTIPEASIISPASDMTITAGQSLIFKGEVKNGNEPFTYLWDFNGTGEDKNIKDPGEIIFDMPGTYTVTFTVSDAQGETVSASINIAVNSELTDTSPAVSIISPVSDTEIYKGQSMEFNAEVTGGNEPMTYLWDFKGAAENVLVKSPGNIVFNIPGEYTIIFTAADADKDTDSKAVSLKVIEIIEPLTPETVFPEHEQADVSLVPVLKISAFVHTGQDAKHAQTQWQISTNEEFSNIVFDITGSEYLTELPVPELVLTENTAYFWRVKYIDTRENESEWSSPAMFTTVSINDDIPDSGITPYALPQAPESDDVGGFGCFITVIEHD
ncbi:NHL repeat and PKD domain-containing protein [Desulfonema limicola]|uniref:NHL repeat and PKD domain-containing protein n=1 Tax=Desulfonema limicola TaxID=45656 RepID=A0A975BA70_9BACT|nr:6-bladed beta-propeller [Desulfonema limicola]QTA81633.1 NHL repeat and PKD domain-containing protein [Desulfonema limicola]